MGTAYNASSSPLFKELNIVKLKDLYKLQVQMFMYDFVNCSLPVPLLRIYQYHGDIHEHMTCHSTDPKHCIKDLVCGCHWMMKPRAQDLKQFLRNESYRDAYIPIRPIGTLKICDLVECSLVWLNFCYFTR